MHRIAIPPPLGRPSHLFRRADIIRTIVRVSVIGFAIASTACAAGLRPLEPRGPVPVSAPRAEDVSGLPDAGYFESNPLMVPVDGVVPSNIPDSFHEPRDGGRIHRATDILAPQGTPVLAAESGTIMRLSQNALGGTTIYMLDDSGRFVMYYAHLLRYADGLTARAHVSQGELLGYVGMTGNAPVPHLHFQAMRYDASRRDYWNGTAVDVRPFFTLPGRLHETNAEQRASESPR